MKYQLTVCKEKKNRLLRKLVMWFGLFLFDNLFAFIYAIQDLSVLAHINIMGSECTV